MKSWTVKQMLAERPCVTYNGVRIEKLWGGKKKLTLLEVLHLDIPPQDRLWVAFRPKALTKKQTAAFLEKTVTRAVTNHALHCGIPGVERWAQKWLDGSDRSESAARSAAWSAWSAWSAAESAARSAAESDAESAARSAWSAEYELQVADLKAVLEE